MLLLLIACNQPTDAVWLDGFSYRWNAFNHRLSFLHMQPLGRTGQTSAQRSA